MSSTLRGYKRHKSDYYITPVPAIISFINEFKKYEPTAFDGNILDPCAGGDINNPMSYPKAMAQIGVNEGRVTTIDIREDSLARIKGDYLKMPNWGYSLIITNPPFNIAEDIIKKALNDVMDGGFVVMLLRLNFFGGKRRLETFWSEVGLPKYSFVHHRRMSFTPDGRTDSIEYQHAVWQKGYNAEFTQLTII